MPPVAGGQHPIATVLSCSDSRVPPELLLNQRLGTSSWSAWREPFPTRQCSAALNMRPNTSTCPSLSLWDTSLAQRSRVPWNPPPATPDPAHANLERILSAIRPGLKHASAGGDRWANAVHASIRQNIEDALRLSPLLKGFVDEGRVLLVGALYDVESGRVDFSNPLPVH